MFSSFTAITALSSFALTVLGAPTPEPFYRINRPVPAAKQARSIFSGFFDSNSVQPTAVSSSDFDSTFLRPALFSRVAYCTPQSVSNLACGEPCDALKAGKGVKVLLAGGDGTDTPHYLVVHDQDQNQLVVAHQGTNSQSILSIANDAKFGLTPLNTSLLPTAPSSGVEVHDGFQETWLKTAPTILSTVQSALKSTGVNKVLVTGHSLGAAIASMDAVMLRTNLPSSVSLKSAVFGLPRGGNAAWASFVDKTLGDNFSFATNQNDPVPDVPPRFLGFVHSSGEFHIKAVSAAGDATSVVDCQGEDNTNCSEGNSLIDASVSNHKGPYLHNISMAHSACPL